MSQKTRVWFTGWAEVTHAAECSLRPSLIPSQGSTAINATLEARCSCGPAIMTEVHITPRG